MRTIPELTTEEQRTGASNGYRDNGTASDSEGERYDDDDNEEDEEAGCDEVDGPRVTNDVRMVVTQIEESSTGRRATLDDTKGIAGKTISGMC